MRLVVIDTNVVVSAWINSEGAPSLIVNKVLDGHIQAVTSPKVSKEYREVTSRAKFNPYGTPPRWIATLIRNSLNLPDPGSWPYECPDPKDTPFIALAHTAGAWLVTGNIKHFPKAIRKGVTVLSPTDYLVHLGAD